MKLNLGGKYTDFSAYHQTKKYVLQQLLSEQSQGHKIFKDIKDLKIFKVLNVFII